MKNNNNTIKLILSLAVIAILFGYSFHLENNKKLDFEKLVKITLDYSLTSAERVANAVVTLPEGNIVVGLKDGVGTYKSESKENGIATIVSDKLKTHLLNGTYKKTSPRLDALVPMYINTDSLGGSVFVVLFQDRGDAAIEKSYARLGGLNIKITEINFLPSDNTMPDEEYRVSIKYSNGASDKEITIPVTDGHFDPKNTLSS